MSPGPPRRTSTAQASQTMITAARRILPRGHPRAIARLTHAPSGKATTARTSTIQPTTLSFAPPVYPSPPTSNVPPRYQDAKGEEHDYPGERRVGGANEPSADRRSGRGERERTGARGPRRGVHFADLSSDLTSATGPRWVSLSGLTIELMLVI